MQREPRLNASTQMIPFIPYDSFGDRGPLVHFAHANAYPPGSYRQLLERLAIRYRVLAIHQRPLWPKNKPEMMISWQTFAEDLIRFFDQEKLSGVVGVGHSLGAVATAMAAVIKPELFSALILIEPVFLSPDVLEMLADLSEDEKAFELPIIRTARRRRDRWSSRQEAFDHFRQKPVFSRLSDESLWDYVNYGFEYADDGDLQLLFRPAWEARIYALQANDVWGLIPKIPQPTLAIRGFDSDTLMPDAWQLWHQSQRGAEFIEVEGSGHLLPMERPAVVAEEIDHFIQKLSLGVR